MYSMYWDFVGSVLIASLFAAGGGGALFGASADLLNGVASSKMDRSPIELFCLAILCKGG